ncbi:hypothetical protein HMN09_00846700 [Mycena chlorophos]|uniref:Uncharacterized protein n=1 Tax=Mycena chlorophos TaxID=658473 RepID=A0A8H6SQZ4_MYCCL|nr:hypothetical protein HMN09_00846700 [Mycena chlorophos]
MRLKSQNCAAIHFLHAMSASLTTSESNYYAIGIHDVPARLSVEEYNVQFITYGEELVPPSLSEQGPDMRVKVFTQNSLLDAPISAYGMEMGRPKAVIMVEMKDREQFVRVLTAERTVRHVAGARSFGHHEGVRAFAGEGKTYIDNRQTGSDMEGSFVMGVFGAPAGMGLNDYNNKADAAFRRLAESPILQKAYRRLRVFYQHDDADAASYIEAHNLPPLLQPTVLILAELEDWEAVAQAVSSPEVGDLSKEVFVEVANIVDGKPQGAVFGVDLAVNYSTKM